MITGAGSGIGREAAKRFAGQCKHKLYLVSRNKQKLDSLKSEILEKDQDSDIELLYGSVYEESDIHKWEKVLSSEFAALDVLIHNAGKLIKKPFADLHMQDWLEVYKVNVFGPAMLTSRMIQFMMKSEIKSSGFRAHIVNISSMGGIQGSQKFPGLSAYSSSKGAVITMTECMAEEFAERKIAVNCLAFGSADTAMFREAFPGVRAGQTAESMAEYLVKFALEGDMHFNGKTLQLSRSTP